MSDQTRKAFEEWWTGGGWSPNTDNSMWQAWQAATERAQAEVERLRGLLAEVREYRRDDYPEWPGSVSIDLGNRIDAALNQEGGG